LRPWQWSEYIQEANGWSEEKLQRRISIIIRIV
jgi:hypothetical protein